MRQLMRRGRRWLFAEVLTEMREQREIIKRNAPPPKPIAVAPAKRASGGMKMDPFSTHQALLTAALAATTGDVLEVGGGWYSTPLLSAFANSPSRRKCYTIETGSYVFGILSPLATAAHRISLLPGFDFDQVGKFKADGATSKEAYIEKQQDYLREWWRQYQSERPDQRLSVAFIDQAPGFLRVPAIRFLADKTDYIITHDTEHVSHYGFEVLSEFRHRWDFALHRPNSAIVSNFFDCSQFSFLAGEQPVAAS